MPSNEDEVHAGVASLPLVSIFTGYPKSTAVLRRGRAGPYRAGTVLLVVRPLVAFHSRFT